MNIILCGLPGVGKTEVGRRFAEKLGWEHRDTDAFLENNHHLSCRDLHCKLGDAEFRNLEHQLLSQWADLTETVISIGGGTLMHPKNPKLLKALGTIIYLKNDLEVIYKQLMNKGIPSFLDSQEPFRSFLELSQQRIPVYQSNADLEYDTHELITLLENKREWQQIPLETFFG